MKIGIFGAKIQMFTKISRQKSTFYIFCQFCVKIQFYHEMNFWRQNSNLRLVPFELNHNLSNLHINQVCHA